MQLINTHYEPYRQQRLKHWNDVANLLDTQTTWGNYYHQRLAQLYQFLVAPGLNVLEIGCGKGDLLAAVQPARGIGIDFSNEMIKRAQQRHPHLQFICADAHALPLEKPFDIIILSDLLNDIWDVQTLLEQVAKLSAPHTRLILNSYSRLWEQPLALAEWLGLAHPTLHQNWLTVEDITNLLYFTHFEAIQHHTEILFPLSIPLLTPLANRYLVKIWPFSLLALTNIIVARSRPQCR